MAPVNMVRRNIKLPLLAAWLLVSACEASSDAEECKVGADCPSGACADGVCVDGAGGQAGSGGVAGSGGLAGDGGAAGSGGAAGGAGGPVGGTGGSTLCSPNHDGSIERAEVPLAAGLNAKFLTSGKTSISSAGELQTDGTRIWDLSVALGGDHLVLAETQKLDGKWFAPKFPGATYASRLSESNQLLGVFEVTATALLLRGVVSPTDGPGRTELTYSPAVVALEFPLAAGKTWTTTTNVTGVASGVMAAYTESYESAVDAQGKLKAPFGEFPVLRTRVVLTRTVGVLKTVVRSYLFATECFGVVASIVAEDNEPNLEVSKAAEVRRLSP